MQHDLDSSFLVPREVIRKYLFIKFGADSGSGKLSNCQGHSARNVGTTKDWCSEAFDSPYCLLKSQLLSWVVMAHVLSGQGQRWVESLEFGASMIYRSPGQAELHTETLSAK